MASWTYMLCCADGCFYVGCTTDLDTRMGQHEASTFLGYTSTRLPVKLVWMEEFQHVDDAITCERWIKGWSRAKKAALIRNDNGAIRGLAPDADHPCVLRTRRLQRRSSARRRIGILR